MCESCVHTLIRFKLFCSFRLSNRTQNTGFFFFMCGAPLKCGVAVRPNMLNMP